MKELDNSCSQGKAGKNGERGISIVELLIVVMMIAVVTAFAVMQIAGAQQAMRLSNSSREFTSWLEKARLDSIRRHATTPATTGDPDLRANVTIASASSYTVTIDQNGDGTLDPPRTITLPPTHGAAFAGVTVPLTIYFNWRGRPVDNAGNSLDLAFRLQDGSGNSNPVNLKSTGDTSVEANVSTSNITVTQLSNTANVKSSSNINYGPWNRDDGRAQRGERKNERDEGNRDSLRQPDERRRRAWVYLDRNHDCAGRHDDRHARRGLCVRLRSL